MAAGDVWEVAIPHYHDSTDPPNQCAVVLWHLLEMSGPGTPVNVAKAVRDAWGPFVDNMGLHVYVPGVYVSNVFPGPGTRTPVRFDTELRGVSDPALFPKGVGVLIERRSALMGRARRGRFWLPWVPVLWRDDVDPTQVSAATAGVIDGLMRDWEATIRGGNSVGLDLMPVVFSERAGDHATHTTPIAQYRLQTHLRQLTRRTRRVDPCPPFTPPTVGDRVYTQGNGLGTGNPTVGVSDGRGWRGLSDRQDNAAALLGGATHWSDPAYDDSGWNHTYAATATFPPGFETCDHADTWRWPPLLFPHYPDPDFPNAVGFFTANHHFHDSATGDSVHAFSGEHCYLRRVWMAADVEVFAATVKHLGDDAREVWLNGSLVYSEGDHTNPIFQYETVVSSDVTALIRRNALNCLALKCYQGTVTNFGIRSGLCHGAAATELRPAWVAAELVVQHL